MQKTQFDRIKMMINEQQFNKLKEACVLVVGCGGVGSFAVESLVRSGVHNLIIMDYDVIDITNINRQLMTKHSNVGQSKVDVLKERMLEINPDVNIIALNMMCEKSTLNEIFEYQPTHVIDACDNVTAKIDLIIHCLYLKIPFISSMGAANKMDPTKVMICDLAKTSVDPLAKVIRIKMRKLKINKKIPVVCSLEVPLRPNHNYETDDKTAIRKSVIPPASNIFVPSVFGITCASYIFKKIITE